MEEKILIENSKLVIKKIISGPNTSGSTNSPDIIVKLDLDNIQDISRPCVVATFKHEKDGTIRDILNASSKFAEIGSTGIEFRCDFVGDEFWVLEKSKKLEKNPQQYSNHDIAVIAEMIKTLYNPKNITKCETLVRALGIDDLTDAFYKTPMFFINRADNSFGEILKNILVDSISKDDKEIKRNKTFLNRETYSRSRYSVYHLMKDIVEDGASIMISKDLTGEYNKISKSGTQGWKFAATWMKVINLLGNRERANMSFKCSYSVTIKVPENKKLGVAADERELNTIINLNIIKDGLVNIDSIGIKGSKEFIQKLKRKHIVEFNILYENEVLVDLKKLPIISRSDIRRPSIQLLSELVKNIELSRIAAKFYELTKPAPKKTAKEKYLESLGIYGSWYFKKQQPAVPATYTYNATTLCSNNSLKSISTADISKYTKGIRTAQIKTISNFLDNLCRINPEREYKLWSEKHEDLVQDYRKYVFELILGKNLKLKDIRKNKNIKIEGLSTYVRDYRITNYVKVNWNIKVKSIEV
jgi:hypothetical protein